MKIKAIFYDFDGVIKDSTDIKSAAFHSLYSPFGENLANKVVAHHQAHGGVSRFEKIKLYHADFLNIHLTENEISDWANRFAELVFQKVIECNYVAGALESIELLSKKYSQFIVTGTPETEIHQILEKLGIWKHFKKAYGAPATKTDICKRILKEENLQPDEVVFIGDATTDYNAAKDCGLHFVLREHHENLIYFKDKDVARIKDLSKFESVINQFNS
ncbi:MAG: HAD family hydrolase [Crocinitomicaceae bacterium]|nr:HAD family hydrolase [Crocinitomicaceae bacterium]